MSVDVLEFVSVDVFDCLFVCLLGPPYFLWKH